LLISLAASVVASIVIYTVLNTYQEELVIIQEQEEETIEVMVAALDLHQGKTITATDLAMKTLPPDYVPDSVLRQFEQAIGRVPRERVLKDEFIREERLADPEAGLGLNAIIPRGMRAVSLNITGEQSVSGFLNPGNWVDVLVTLGGHEERPPETITLLQAKKLLAVQGRLSQGVSIAGGQGITLAVTPEEALRLSHAMSSGGISLTLRNDIDVTKADTHGAIADDFLGGTENKEVITVAEWKERTVKRQDGTLTIIRGPSVSKERVSAQGLSASFDGQDDSDDAKDGNENDDGSEIPGQDNEGASDTDVDAEQ
jgi:pilus assembly protein CpaB